MIYVYYKWRYAVLKFNMLHKFLMLIQFFQYAKTI